jgi:hypothetical protein
VTGGEVSSYWLQLCHRFAHIVQNRPPPVVRWADVQICLHLSAVVWRLASRHKGAALILYRLFFRYGMSQAAAPLSDPTQVLTILGPC